MSCYIESYEFTLNHISDDHYYQIQSERSRILLEKDTLAKLYQELLEQNKTLQGDFVS